MAPAQQLGIRIVSAMAAMARLSRIWTCNTISFASKFKLYRSLVTSILYGCKTWTLPADSEKSIQAFETKCLGKLLRISCFEHKTKEKVRSKINSLVGPQERLLATSRDGNLHGSGVSHATTVSPTPSFRTAWWVGDAVVGNGNAGWTT